MKQWKEIVLFIALFLLWTDVFLFFKANLIIIIPVSVILALLPILFKKRILHWYKGLFIKKSHTGRAHS